MLINRKKIIKKFHELPGKLPFKHYRFFVFTNYVFLLCAVFHFLFIWIFALLDLKILCIYNIFSTVIWMICLYLNLRGTQNTPLLLANLEVLIHAGLCCTMIGWPTGFHYYILGVPMVIFLSLWPINWKILLCTFNGIVYLFLNYYSSNSFPLTAIDSSYMKLFNSLNIAFIFFTISYCAFYYRIIVLKVEEKLEIAHINTLEAFDQLNANLSDAADYVKSILPKPIREDSVCLSWKFIPSESLGGDAFGYHWLDNDNLAVYLFDVSGHGVSAALLSAAIMNVLRSRSLSNVNFHEPNQVLSGLNRSFPSEKNKDMFFTIWYGVYNKQSRHLAYASGGHPPALLFSDTKGRNNGRATQLGTPNPIIGAFEETKYKKNVQVLNDKTCLYIFSDGVYEFLQPNGKRWKYNEFADHMGDMHFGDEKDIDRLVDYVKDLTNSKAFEDDFTIMKVIFA